MQGQHLGCYMRGQPWLPLASPCADTTTGWPGHRCHESGRQRYCRRRSMLLIDQEHMKLTPTLSSPRCCCSYYDVVRTSVISVSSLYWPLLSPCCNPIYHTCSVSCVKLHQPSSIYHVWMQEDGVPCR